MPSPLQAQGRLPEIRNSKFVPKQFSEAVSCLGRCNDSKEKSTLWARIQGFKKSPPVAWCGLGVLFCVIRRYERRVLNPSATKSPRIWLRDQSFVCESKGL